MSDNDCLHIIGVDGNSWGKVVNEIPDAWVLESGNIVEKNAYGLKWVWQDFYELIGYRVEEQYYSCSFGEEQYPRYTILLKHDKVKSNLIPSSFQREGRYLKMICTVEWGECGSGYCSATWCDTSLPQEIERNEFGPIHYIPKETILGHLDKTDDDNMTFISWDKTVFEISHVGDDGYYPTGYCEFNDKLFKPTKRFEETSTILNHIEPIEATTAELPNQVRRKERIIYIFHGPSDLGKSSLAIHCDLNSYDTDQCEIIPDDIHRYHIIVVGNRFPNHKNVVESMLKLALEKDENFFKATCVSFS